jgi:hypothetical protein
VSALADAGPGAPDPSAEELLGQIASLDVRQLLLSTVMTLASLAYGKLDAGERDQARVAIEALAALIPVLADGVEEDVTRDLRTALANLQVAFASAAPGDP